MKVNTTKDLQKLERKIKILKEIVKTDRRDIGISIHKQALNNLIKHRKNLNIKK